MLHANPGATDYSERNRDGAPAPDIPHTRHPAAVMPWRALPCLPHFNFPGEPFHVRQNFSCPKPRSADWENRGSISVLLASAVDSEVQPPPRSRPDSGAPESKSRASKRTVHCCVRTLLTFPDVSLTYTKVDLMHVAPNLRLAIVQHRHPPARGLLSLISLLSAFFSNRNQSESIA